MTEAERQQAAQHPETAAEWREIAGLLADALLRTVAHADVIAGGDQMGSQWLLGRKEAAEDLRASLIGTERIDIALATYVASRSQHDQTNRTERKETKQ